MQRIRERVREHRTPEHDIDPIFVNRWSPRSMTGERLDPEEYDVHALVAIGGHAPDDDPESEQPNGRKPLEGILIEGGFPEGGQR